MRSEFKIKADCCCQVKDVYKSELKIRKGDRKRINSIQKRQCAA